MKVVAMVVLLLCLCTNSEQGKKEATIQGVDKSEQFGGVKLGSPLTAEFTEWKGQVFERQSYSSDGIKWYRYSRAPESMDSVAIRNVDYGFQDERLVEIVIAFAVQAEPSKRSAAFAKLQEIYKDGAKVTHESWRWSGEKVGLELSGFCSLDSGSLSFLYIFPKSRIYKPAELNADESRAKEKPPTEFSK